MRWIARSDLGVSLATGRVGLQPEHAHRPDARRAPSAYTAIGASDGIGFGGSVVCAPFDPDCPQGPGYVYLLEAAAAERTVAP